jgi:phage tail tape-measure protein
MAFFSGTKEEQEERGQAGLSGALRGAATGASLGAAVGGPVAPITAVAGAIAGAAGGFFYGRNLEKQRQEDEAEAESALDELEKEGLELARRQSKQAEAAAQRASAQGKILGGPVDDIVFEAASTGANLEGFKRRNFPTYG